MIGPLLGPLPPLGQGPLPPAHAAAAAQGIDSPRLPVATRPPLELPLDRVDAGNAARGLATNAREEPPEPEPSPAGGIELAEAPNAGVTFEILRDVDNLIQSHVVDRTTREVLRSVPPEELVAFYRRFDAGAAAFDVEA